MVYLWVRYILVMPLRRAVWVYAVMAWHYHLALVVAFDNKFAIFLQLLLLHGEFCRNHLAKRRDCLGKSLKNILYIAVQYHVNDRREIVGVFLADGSKIRIHYRNLYLIAGFLLNKTDNRCSLCGGRETIFVYVVIVAYTLTCVTTDKEYIAYFILLANQWLIV